MKKRIIAALLVAIMTVLSLASCGFDLAKDDLSDYIEGEFDVDAFMEAIRNIDIEDGEYTTDAATNDKIIASDIYGPIASGVITAAGTYEDDKLTEGQIGDRDVVYYCYYITYEDENGVVRSYKLSEMQESTITASATKAKHVINLGNYNADDEFTKKLSEALLAKGEDVKYYSMMDASAVKKELGNDALNVAADYTIAVSYTVKYKNAEGGEITEKASYEIINLGDAENELAAALASYIGKAGTTLKVGEKVAVAADNYTEENKSTKGSFTVGENTYSEITVNYMVDKSVAAGEEITFTYTDSSLVSVSIDSRNNTAQATTTDLSKKEVTFHVYPVYRLEVPENSAESILEYVYAKKLSDFLKGSSTSGFGYGSGMVSVLNEILTDAEYKYTEGETTKTVTQLTDALSKLWAGTYSDYATLSDLEKARKDANTAVEDAIEAKETATDKDAAEAVIVEKEEALEAAEKALDLAVRNQIRIEIGKVVAAKKGELVLGTELLKTLDEELRHDRKEEYDNYITETVAKEIYKIIDKQIKVVAWPEDLVDEFYDHIYDSYEYNFYNGKYTPEGATTSTQSNYLQYGGDFKEYLKAQTKATDDDGIEAALTKEAQDYITPLIKIYVVAQALDEYDFGGKSADELLTDYVEADIEIGVSSFKAYNYYSSYFKSYYFYNDSLTDKENEKQEKNSKENAEKSVENALEAAEDFLMDDAAFKVYKNQLGSKNYRAWESSYGEINMRAGLQVNKLFYLLTSTNNKVEVDEEDQHIHTQVIYEQGEDGKYYHSYRLISYKVH